MSGSALYRHSHRQHLAADGRVHQALDEVFGGGVIHRHTGAPIGLQGSPGKLGAETIDDPTGRPTTSPIQSALSPHVPTPHRGTIQI